jgi:hypothetical protein
MIKRPRYAKVKPKIRYPTNDAIIAGISASTSKSFLYRISVESIAPPRGARNMLPIPAPIPAAIAILLS